MTVFTINWHSVIKIYEQSYFKSFYNSMTLLHQNCMLIKIAVLFFLNNVKTVVNKLHALDFGMHS